LFAQVANIYAGKSPKGMFISSLSLKNPVVSSCWYDYMSRLLEYRSQPAPRLITSTVTSKVGGQYSYNTSIPLVIRCDGRSYITAQTKLYHETTTIHPPVTVTRLNYYPFFLWKPDPTCSALKMKDCREAYNAFSSATSAAISSVYSDLWPSVPTLAANNSVTTLVLPENIGRDGKSGLPPRIIFTGNGISGGGLSGAAGGVDSMCRDVPPVLETCPSRPVVDKCQLVAYAMTVYYWPTSSVGDYCGAKTRMPATMTIPGTQNTALVINKGLSGGFTTVVTSPSALVHVPWINQQFQTGTTAKNGIPQLWTTCGNEFTTSAAFKIHPDDLSAVKKYFVTTEIWTTDVRASTSGRMTRYQGGTKTESADLAGVYNPAWLKEDFDDDSVECRQIYNGDIHPTEIVSTITESQVASMQQSKCTRRVLHWKDAPALALPTAQLLNALDQEWLNWGGKPNADGKPFCKAEPTRVWNIKYIALDSATVTGMGPPLITRGPAVTVTITTEPPWAASEQAAFESLLSKYSKLGPV
jgi:hypothetical protein